MLSITHSDRCAEPASEISARDGIPVFASDSSTCVASTTGTRAAWHISVMLRGISESDSKPISTARSPRAIITPIRSWRMASSTRSGSAR